MRVSAELASGVAEFFRVLPYTDIVEWAKDAIDFSSDVSAERSRLDFSLSPHLVEPLRTWDFRGKIREVTVCGIEQHGKTLLEVVGALYSMIFNPGAMLCVYPSIELAKEVNRLKYEPLIRNIPSLAAQLNRRYSKGRDRYIFDTSTMFFQGAGTKIMSRSCRVRIADELDRFPVVKELDNVEDIRKRGRSYSESMYFKSSSPSDPEKGIWKEFLNSSQGYWTLRCQKCGLLTMRSCDFENFQFDSVFDETQKMYVPKSESIRLVCPKCGHSHTESDKYALNRQGAYVHVFPDRVDLNPGFQFGALCSLFPAMSWTAIAAKILACGKRADVKAHYELDNSWKGLPYHEREVSRQDMEKLKIHFYKNSPDPSTFEFIFLVSDTQDLFSPTGLFAWDAHGSLWLLHYANLPYLDMPQGKREELSARGIKPAAVVDWLDREWYEGIHPLFHVIDYRGHRQPEVKDYCNAHSNVVMYAGEGKRLLAFKQSTVHPRMFIVDAKHYQQILIHQLYQQHNAEENFLWLPDTLDSKFQQEITCVQPDNTRKSGHLFENWAPEHDAVHDCFDVLKMAYFAVDFASQNFRRERFRLCKAPDLVRRFEALPPSSPVPAAPAAPPRNWSTSF